MGCTSERNAELVAGGEWDKFDLARWTTGTFPADIGQDGEGMVVQEYWKVSPTLTS